LIAAQTHRSAAPPVDPVSETRFRGFRSWLTWVALGCLLAFAAWLRFTLPAVPFADPDTYGYLNPGLNWLRSGVFQQTHGRSLFYPLFVAVLLKTTGSFSAIPLCQHVLGVSSGLLWWMLWRGGVRWLPPGFCRAWLAPLIGLAGLAVYLFGAELIVFEHSLRPEAIFPFFALAHLAALYACVRRVLEGADRVWVVAGLGALALGLDSVVLSLKPSWGFASLVAPAVLVGCFFLRTARRGRLALAAAIVLGGGIVWILNGALPRALHWKPDQFARLFLPQTLVSVHADKIVAEFERGTLDPREVEFAGRFARAFERSFAGEGVQPYVTLGFNPDFILYESGVFQSLPVAPDTVESRRDYLLGLYFRSLRARPWDFAAKWGGELLRLYRPGHKQLFRAGIRQRKEYEYTGSQAWLAHPQPNPGSPPWLEAALEDYRAQLQEARVAAPAEHRTCPVGPKTHKKYGVPILKAAAWALGPIILGIPFLGLCCGGRFRDLRRFLGFGCVGVAFSLGAGLTVAIVHSFSIERYSAVLLFLHSLLLGVGLLLGGVLLERVLTWTGRRLLPRLHLASSQDGGAGPQ
jgi:hypothetical protein